MQIDPIRVFENVFVHMRTCAPVDATVNILTYFAEKRKDNISSQVLLRNLEVKLPRDIYHVVLKLLFPTTCCGINDSTHQEVSLRARLSSSTAQ